MPLPLIAVNEKYVNMKLHHFIASFELNERTAVVTDTKVIHHLSDVLKIGVGERVVIGNGKGNEITIRLSEITPEKIVGTVLEQEAVLEEAGTITLYVSMLKRDSFEFVVQKATEIGITTIVPLITDRTVKLGFNRERLERIIAEAAEQSERALLPEIKDPLTFSVALESSPREQRYFFDREGVSFKDVKHSNACGCSLWIGPEGGWSPAEVARAQEAGAAVISLGKGMLRAETAAIVTSFWAKNF